VSPFSSEQRSVCQLATNLSHAHGTKHTHRRLIPEMRGEKFFFGRKEREYFRASIVVELKFVQQAHTIWRRNKQLG
jgi:hypothetical protein